MARKSRETEQPSRRRKRTEPSKPVPHKKKTSPLITIFAVIAAMFIAWSVLIEDEHTVPRGKIAPSIIGVLDQVYLGCTVFWFNQGSQYPCDQKIADQFHDSKAGDIKVVVTNSFRKEYSAEGKHISDRMVFRIDADGEIFIRAKECETNIELIDIAELNFEELEAQCKPK